MNFKLKLENMKNLNLLRRILGVIGYILFIPLTIIQVVYFIMQYLINRENLFLEHAPLSYLIYDKIINPNHND